MTPPESRFPIITETAPGKYLLTIGNTTVALDTTELHLLMDELRDTLETPTPSTRLRHGLSEVLYEVNEILTNDPRLTRAYSLTSADLDRLLDLQGRVMSPWE